MALEGWVKLHRKMLENPIIMKDAEHFAVWTYILLNAAHAEYPVLFKGEKINLKPGQLITGRKSIATKLKISESKVTRILNTFQIEQQIEQQTSNKNRLISVVNWGLYQSSEHQAEHQLNINRTSTEQQLNTNKNIKNKKNEENEKNAPDFLSEIYDDFCSKLADYYPAERFDKDEAFSLWVEKVKGDDEPQKKSDDIGRVIFNYLNTFIGEERKYIPKLSNVLGKDYVRIVEANLNTDECDDKYADFPPVLRKYLKKHAQKDEV